jgi:cholesterol oxidase
VTRRALALPPLEVVDFSARDGAALRLYHVPAATPGIARGPVLLAPGTAMSGLSFCIDTVPQNLAEHLHAAGFDVWLFDWRTSPDLPAHALPYTLDGVGRDDWPAAVDVVIARTGRSRVGIFAHCLSAPALVYALVRGHLPRERVSSVVLSQVAFHLHFPMVGRIKAHLHLDEVMPAGQTVHFRPGEVTLHFADAAVTALAAVVPKSYVCDSVSCHRLSAAFGDLLFHENVDAETHALVGDLIPEVNMGFLDAVAPLTRESSALTDEDERHLERLALPITLISGARNMTFLPEATERSYVALCAANGAGFYVRHVVADHGHLDCLVGVRAAASVYPLVAAGLARG